MAARHPERVQTVISIGNGGDWQEYLRQEVIDWKEHPHSEESEWGKITAPMLLIAGEKDAYANKERLEQIKERCPQAEIFLVEGCGHRPHFPEEEAKKVNEKMLTFLRKYA